jgi:hypothetical protein
MRGIWLEVRVENLLDNSLIKEYNVEWASIGLVACDDHVETLPAV